MNTQSLLSPTVASLAIIRDNQAAPSGAAIRHVAVFLASIARCGKHQFQIHEQAFPGSEDGRDVADWLGNVIPHGADIALRSVSSLFNPLTLREEPAPWWPIADMAWLRQRFGEEPRIWTMDLSDSDIFETVKAMELPCAVPGNTWQVRAAHAAGEAQAIWYQLLTLTCDDDEIDGHIAGWRAWISAEQARAVAT